MLIMNDTRELVVIECVNCDEQFETLINTTTGDYEDVVCPNCRGIECDFDKF